MPNQKDVPETKVVEKYQINNFAFGRFLSTVVNVGDNGAAMFWF